MRLLILLAVVILLSAAILLVISSKKRSGGAPRKTSIFGISHTFIDPTPTYGSEETPLSGADHEDKPYVIPYWVD